MRDFDWRIITTLHRTGSITKTAELLFMSQPALTKRIQTIESELGATLIIRSHQGSAFTPEGERIARKAERVVKAIQNVMDEASAESRGEKGSLRLGIPYSYVRHILPEILARFTEKYPNVNIDIVTMASHDLINCVENGTIDICFARYSAENSSLRRFLFSDDRACIICGRPFQIEELENMPYVDFPKNPGSQSAINRWWDEHFEEEPNCCFKVATADACISMVQHGIGFGIILDEKYLEYEAGLYSMPLAYEDGSVLRRKTYVFFRDEGETNPAMKNFIRLISPDVI